MIGFIIEAGGGISEGIVIGRIGVKAFIGAVIIVRFGCSNKDFRFSVIIYNISNSATFFLNFFINSVINYVKSFVIIFFVS